MKGNVWERPQARENGNKQVAVGFKFASDWLRGWRGFSILKTQCSGAKQY